MTWRIGRRAERSQPVQKRSFVAVFGSVVTAVGVVVGTFAGAPPAGASSHREAPMIAGDPYADLTDVYAFVSPDKPDTVSLIMDAIPYEDPMGGPNYYQFDPKVRYEMHIAQSGHNSADLTYRVEFQTSVQNPNTFLYQTGPYAKAGDMNLNVRQTATVTRVTRDSTETVIGSGLPVQPVNIGPHSNPQKLMDKDTGNNANGVTGTAEVSPLMNGEGTFYAGQRADPFFLDLGVFDLLALRPFDDLHKVVKLNKTDGVNSFNGFNVHTIALQVPATMLTSDGQAPRADGSNSIIGVWATTSRQQVRVLGTDGSSDAAGDWVQIERLGNPLVNEVVVPLGAKDLFNATPPTDDAQFLPAVLNPELPGLINALYGVPVPTGDRNDLVTIFLTGIPGLNQPANVQPAELLRLNMGIAPTAGVGKGNRMGVLGGDNAGFPNGRRPEDDVVDIAIQAMAGATPLTPDFNKAPNNLLGDGVNASAQSLGERFPYVGQPYEGFKRAGGTASSPTGE
jgi:Domain of unknown function (DUF4331)